MQDQITIRQDTAAPQMIFVSDTLFCTTDSIQILNTNSNPSFEYSWQGVMLGSEQISSPWVNTDGEKRVEVVNPANGCTQQVIVPVIAFNQPLQIDVSIGAITCIDSIVRPQVTSASTLSTVRWTLGQSTVMGVRPILRQAGVYNVYFEDIYGCTLDTLIGLELYTIALPISL